MQCSILQENIHQALGIILRIISTKSELPVLANVLITAQKGKIIFSGTNLEMGVRIIIGGKIEKDGAITVPARLLSEYVATLGSSKVLLITKETLLFVQAGKSEASFATIPASEFPPFPDGGENAFSFATADFQLLSKQVAFAASNDSGRPVLTGVQIKRVDNELVVAATDGFRLSVRQLPTVDGQLPQVIVPARALEEVSKIATDKKNEKVTLSLAKNANQLIFKLPDIELFSRLVEGEFPGYERIIPQTSATRVVFEREQLVQAVRAASIFARESANIVRLKITKEKVILSANTPQLGGESTELEAEVDGDGGEIAFNFHFLLDYLGSTEESLVTLEMTNPLSPALFRLKNDSSYRHVIMPVRVQSSS